MKRFFLSAFFRYLTLNFCLIIFAIKAIGQTSVLDSLENELQLHTKEDTNRVNLLTQFAHIATDIDLTKAEKACQEARRIALKLNYEIGIANVYYERAWIHIEKSDYQSAIENAKKALEIYRNSSSLEGESFSLNCIGTSYYYQSNYPKAIEYYLKSAEIDEARNDLKGISGSYLNIGNIYADQGEFDQSLSYYFKALELKKKVKDDSGIAKCLGNIGSVYGEQGNYPKALDYFKKAQVKHEKLGNSINASICLMNIGSIYLHQEKLNKAFSTFNQVIELNKGNDNKRIQAMAFNEIGSVLSKKKEYPNALDYFSSALAINRDGNNLRAVASNLNNIGSILLLQKKYKEALIHFEEAKQINESNDLKMGLCSSLIGISKIYLEQSNYQQALEYGLSAKLIAYASDLLAHQRDVTEILSKIYNKLGEYEQALHYHQDFKRYSDSIFNKDKIEKIAQIEYDFKFQKELEVFNAKEQKLTKKVELTNKDLEKSESRLLIGIVVFLIVLLIAAILIFQLRLRHIKSQNENSLLEQKLLRSQMTPHFIFNSLSVLQGMILNKEDQKASLYLSKFSKLLRVTLESSREKMTPLSQEIIALENYVAIQNIESNQSFTFTIRVADTIHSGNILIPPMLIQPFVENAIEHAFTPDHREKKIEVEFSFPDNQLICTITDNGIGVQEKKNRSVNSKKSLATSISKERIQLLARELKTEGSIQIVDRKSNNENGTQVTLVIPYKFGKQ